MAKPSVHIDVTSDISCPWCWVGKRRLDKAVEQVQDAVDVTVRYHPFVIDHGTAPQGEEYVAYNVRRWGGDGWCAGLRRSGRPDGAAFSNWQWWPNSVRAHQLLLLAQEQGLGRQCKDLLLCKTYEEGANVSLVDTLVQCAAELGLRQSADEVRAYLEEDRGRPAVLQLDAAAKQQRGISGVPYFSISGPPEAPGQRYALSGAQPTSALLQAINKVVAEQQGS